MFRSEVNNFKKFGIYLGKGNAGYISCCNVMMNGLHGIQIDGSTVQIHQTKTGRHDFGEKTRRGNDKGFGLITDAHGHIELMDYFTIYQVT